MVQGARANLVDEPVAAESAYGAAVAIQEKAFGRDSPNVADPLIHLALQVSNQGRFAEARAMFTRAEALVPRQGFDPTLGARLLHFEGLDASNQGQTARALQLLRAAEAGYSAALPPEALLPRPESGRGGGPASLGEVLSTQADRQNLVALLGLVEVRRNEAVTLRTMGRLAESSAALASAAALARDAQLDQPSLVARLRRTAAVSAAQSGDQPLAIADFGNSNAAFSRAYPGSRPLALIELLRGQELMRAGQPGAAAEVCRSAVQTLVELKTGYEPERVLGCMDAFAAVAAASGEGAGRQAALQDLFLASQVVRGSQTEQQINQSAARLGEGKRDPKVAAAIRAQQDATAALAAVQRQRAAVAEAVRAGAPQPANAKLLDERERAAMNELALRESELQAASPNYGQLVQQATKAPDVLRLLGPGEAFAAITLTKDSGYTILLRDGTVRVNRIEGGAGVVDPIVGQIRLAMQPDTPPFDTAGASELFRVLFGGLDADLASVRALTVAPTGSLLSLPFGLLLTGQADQTNLAAAPWLAKRMAIGHLPSASNFVALRRQAGGSKAARPWFGFGDFLPVTLAQARRSFGAGCGDSAALFAGLPPLPSARAELSVAGRLLGASPQDELLGAAFTVPAVQHADLADYRVLHFATHAILPTDLKCESEPAIVTSAPPGAPDASGALLKASDVAQAKLDADLVILSACNTGGSDGSVGGGESLSGLARSFFFAGARALLITHWEVSDQAATFLIAETLRRLQADPGISIASALQGAQTELLTRAGSSLPVELAHPFYWAPFALIGIAGDGKRLNTAGPAPGAAAVRG